MQEGSQQPASESRPATGTPTAKTSTQMASPRPPFADASTPPAHGAEQESAVRDTRTAEPVPTGETVTLREWVRLAHVPYLIVALAPVVVTAAWLWTRGVHLAVGPVVVTALGAMAGLAGALLLDASAQCSSSTPVTLAAAPPVVLRAAIILLVLGAALGVPLVLAGGTPVLALGGAALLAAVAYSTSPYALKRLPVGELAVGLVCGPGLVAITVLAQRQPITPFALALGAGLGLFAAALREAANLCAVAAGASADRRTLARMLGMTGGRLVYLATVAAAYLAVAGAAAWRAAPHGALAVLFSLPVAVLPLTGALRGRAAATLTPVVTGTLRAYCYFAFWLVIGLLLGTLYLHLLRLAGS